MADKDNIHLIVRIDEPLPLKSVEPLILNKYWDYVKRKYKRIFIHYVGKIGRPEYLYYFKKLLDVNLVKTIVIKYHNSVDEAITEIGDEEHEILTLD